MVLQEENLRKKGKDLEKQASLGMQVIYWVSPLHLKE